MDEINKICYHTTMTNYSWPMKLKDEFSDEKRYNGLINPQFLVRKVIKIRANTIDQGYNTRINIHVDDRID